jgi:hypothetical protein
MLPPATEEKEEMLFPLAAVECVKGVLLHGTRLGVVRAVPGMCPSAFVGELKPVKCGDERATCRAEGPVEIPKKIGSTAADLVAWAEPNLGDACSQHFRAAVWRFRHSPGEVLVLAEVASWCPASRRCCGEGK